MVSPAAGLLPGAAGLQPLSCISGAEEALLAQQERHHMDCESRPLHSHSSLSQAAPGPSRAGGCYLQIQLRALVEQ